MMRSKNILYIISDIKEGNGRDFKSYFYKESIIVVLKRIERVVFH